MVYKRSIGAPHTMSHPQAKPPHNAAQSHGNPTENRDSPRHSVLRAAQLKYDDQITVIECIVTDISQSGMRALVDVPDDLPDRFSIHLKHSDKTRRCELRWKNSHEIGVKLIG